MDFVSPIVDVVSRLCGCTTNRVIYIRELEENLRILRNSSDELVGIRNDVRGRVETQELNQMRRTGEVAWWLQTAEAMETQVDGILTQGRKDIEERCLGSCCPRNCCASYKLGKKVVRIIGEVQRLRDQGRAFDTVAKSLPPPPVQEMPTVQTTGMDFMFQRACSCISEEQVGIMGIYGIGGVGKTTLLERINNEFLHSGTSNKFDVVIWVVVSKEIRMLKIQEEIAKRLGLSLPEDGSLHDRVAKLYSVLSKKIFLLLLDDIWDRVDLGAIGIPRPDIDNKSKVVFTTRSELVCGQMEAHKKIKVECLGWPESWKLFQEKVGEEALNSHPQIPVLAPDVAKECAGLPLALITIGRAMSSKKTPQEWKHAATVLKKSASEFSDMRDKVFPILKFSYDTLCDDTIKSCFLYCSLFPEDCSISIDDFLIPYWIGEGFLDTCDDINEAQNRGYDIIGILKQACLLENSSREKHVKMHDVLRDLALWIGCDCGRKKDGFLVKAGIELKEAPEVGKWREAKRISLMENNIETLGDEAPTCPKLSTLIVNENRSLCYISDGFFQYMHVLRVLDLSRTNIEELPKSVVELVELQYLGLSGTNIRDLPQEITNLVQLKCLDLSDTWYLKAIPCETLSRISKLQWLDLTTTVSFYNHDGGASIEELEFLKGLKYLSITIRKASSAKRLIDSGKFTRCTLRLYIHQCDDLTFFSLSNCLNLELLNVNGCKSLKVICDGTLDGYFPKLREVCIRDCKVLEDLSGLMTGCLKNLQKVVIFSCPALKDLSWLRGASNLERLEISECPLTQLFINGARPEYLPTHCEVHIFGSFFQ